MLLWFLFAVMTGVALLAVVIPLSRRPREAGRSEHDLAIYRDQLAAVDGDVARGVLRAEEAEAARVEISRRLLAAADRAETAGATAPSLAARSRLAMGLAATLVAVSLGGYLLLGSPGLPGQPLAERQARPVEQQDVELLISRIEAHLRDNPRDGRGWDIIAPIYLRLGRYEAAAQAYDNALRLMGESPERLSGQGEALTQANDGMVTAAARAAFDRALALEPDLVRPRFYVALSLEQDGKLEAAAEAWRAMLAEAPADAPWRPVVAQRLATVEKSLGRGGGAAPGPGELRNTETEPGRDDARRAEQMVARLAQRLAADGADLEGWLMLMRSYVVLGRREEARAAMVSARGHFSDNDEALKRIADAAAVLGLDDGPGPAN